jgi:DNA-3-methyladenine glycosylase
MNSSDYTILPRNFYTRPDVVAIARELLGKVLYANVGNEISAGIITETEAYAGITDKASHAYNNRRTPRTEIMYHNGGTAYVYLCYGIHSLFNIVTSVDDQPHAVLIRGIKPLLGVETMKHRSGKPKLSEQDGIGPGKVARLLGIAVRHSGLDMCAETVAGDRIWVQDEGVRVAEDEIITGPRIGIDYAGEDALLPYRFRWGTKK